MIFTILLGLFGLGVIIFIHEFGHFIAAKLNGIEVEIFSIGFGKKLFGFKHNKTLYQISVIPFGGYCKLKGDDMLRIAIQDDLTKIPDEEGSFFSVHPLRRVAVAVAGPVANLVFAFIVLTVVWWSGFTIYSSSNKIVLATDYSINKFLSEPPATKAGLQTGDIITGINGRKVRNFQDLLEIVSENPGKNLIMTIKRNEKRINLKVVPELDTNTGAGRIGVYAWIKPEIWKISKNSAAWIAGLKPGDIITYADKTRVKNVLDISRVLKKKPSKIVVKVLRNGNSFTATLLPFYNEKGIPELGITFKEERYKLGGVGFVNGIKRGYRQTINTIEMTFKGISLMFKGINMHNAVAGPLRIGYYIGKSTSNGFAVGIKTGIVSFSRLLALLSIVLFIMNLLPLPAFDGGQTILFLIEYITGKKVGPKLIYRIQVFGFSLMILLAVVITFSDVLFFMGK